MEDPASGYGFQPVYQGEERNYTCSGLQRVTVYSFRVAATNDRGMGPFSSPSAVFSTIPDVPGQCQGCCGASLIMADDIVNLSAQTCVCFVKQLIRQ